MFTRFAARMTRALRRFPRARKGTAAVEFSIIVLPFFILTFGLAEVAMIGFAQTSLNFAVSEASRQIRTGQAQMGGVSYAEIQQELCDEMNQFIVLTCENNLFLDVDRFNSFVDAANANQAPIQNGQFQNNGFAFAPGAPSDIVVVRAYYRWHVMTPMFENVFANVANGERILISTMMFRNEPYQ